MICSDYGTVPRSPSLNVQRSNGLPRIKDVLINAPIDVKNRVDNNLLFIEREPITMIFRDLYIHEFTLIKFVILRMGALFFRSIRIEG